MIPTLSESLVLSLPPTHLFIPSVLAKLSRSAASVTLAGIIISASVGGEGIVCSVNCRGGHSELNWVGGMLLTMMGVEEVVMCVDRVARKSSVGLQKEVVVVVVVVLCRENISNKRESGW